MENLEMKNQLEIANSAIAKLNSLYNENIFALKYGSEQDCATVINENYRYEGNDVDITFSEDGIVGTATGSTVSFSSIEDLLENIDQLFINDNA